MRTKSSIIDLSKVDNKKTREYLLEVISSFKNKNYRSAIVMLYSVCVCDLFFKLIELRDVFSDDSAKSLLKRLEEKIEKDKTNSDWEKDLIETLYKQSPLLDSQSYACLIHLRDYRNLSAHPVMDDYSDLFSPSKEIVEALIKESYNNILTKPALLIKNVVDVLSEDLSEKKGYLIDDKDGFETYVHEKYLRRMPDVMKQRVFRAFWKFTFVLCDQNCKDNRHINYCFLRFLYFSNKELLQDDIRKENEKYDIFDDTTIIQVAFWFLSIAPELYPLLPKVSKRLLSKRYQSDSNLEMLSWFLHKDKESHIKSLIEKDNRITLSGPNYKNFVYRRFKETEDIYHLCHYYIWLAKTAVSYRDANTIVIDYVLPYLSDMTKDQIEEVIGCFCKNGQIYNNYSFSHYCSQVWTVAKECFDREYITTTYPRFVIPDTTEEGKKDLDVIE